MSEGERACIIAAAASACGRGGGRAGVAAQFLQPNLQLDQISDFAVKFLQCSMSLLL